MKKDSKGVLKGATKVLSIVLAGTLMASSFTGCGKKTTNKNDATTEASIVDNNQTTQEETTTYSDSSPETDEMNFNNYYCQKYSVFKIKELETDKISYVIGKVKRKNDDPFNYLMGFYIDIMTLPFSPGLKHMKLMPEDYKYFARKFEYWSYETIDGTVIYQEKIGDEAEIVDTGYAIIDTQTVGEFLENNNFDNIPQSESDLKDLETVINTNYIENSMESKTKTMQ